MWVLIFLALYLCIICFLFLLVSTEMQWIFMFFWQNNTKCFCWNTHTHTHPTYVFYKVRNIVRVDCWSHLHFWLFCWLAFSEGVSVHDSCRSPQRSILSCKTCPHYTAFTPYYWSESMACDEFEIKVLLENIDQGNWVSTR